MSWFLGVKSIYERQKNQCMVVWIMHLSWGNGRGRELLQGLNWTMSPGDLSMMGWPLPYFGNYIAFLSQKIPQIICQDQSDSEDYTCGPVLLHPCTDALFFKSVSSNVFSDLLLQIHQQRGETGHWTASPSYWALITSWWKFEMSSSPINFYCFTGLAHLRKVSILTSLCPLGRVPKK